MTVGGDVEAIDLGGTALRECARALNAWPEDVGRIRTEVDWGAGETPGGVDEAVRRWAAAYGAAGSDSLRLLDALGVLATSTAADLAASDVAVAAMLAGPF